MRKKDMHLTLWKNGHVELTGRPRSNFEGKDGQWGIWYQLHASVKKLDRYSLLGLRKVKKHCVNIPLPVGTQWAHPPHRQAGGAGGVRGRCTAPLPPEGADVGNHFGG